MLNNHIRCGLASKSSKEVIIRTLFQYQNAAKPSRLSLRFKVQVPTAVSVRFFLVCYKCSGDGLSKLRFRRQRRVSDSALFADI